MKRASLADAERFPLRSPEAAAKCHQSGDTPAPGRAAAGRTLWWWVAAGFLFLAVLWTAMFVVARSAHIEAVPLPPRGAQP